MSANGYNQSAASPSPDRLEHKGSVVRHRKNAFWVNGLRFRSKDEALLYVDF